MRADRWTAEAPASVVSDDSRSAMRLMAEVSGGTAVVNSNNFAGNFKKLVETKPVRYVLSYASPANQRDGQYHSIEVRLKKPGLKVKARRGYYAFRPGGSITPAVPMPENVSPRARAVIESERPVSDISAMARASSLSVGQPSAAVLVGLQIDDLNNAFDAVKPIELVWTAVNDDGYGAQVAVERRVIRIPARAAGAASTKPLAIIDRLMLPEGRYRITGVASQANGPLATAQTTVSVVSRPSEPYGFTDIVMAASKDNERDVMLQDNGLRDLLPHVPAIRPEFARQGMLEVMTEFHDVSEWFSNLTLRMTASSPRTGVVWKHEEKMTFKTSDQQAAVLNPWMAIAGRRISYKAALPLEKLTPGSYTIRVEAVGSGARSVSVNQEAAFTVF
jgi:hypothetical protein